MASRSQSPKLESPDLIVTDTEDDNQSLYPPLREQYLSQLKPEKVPLHPPKPKFGNNLSTLLKFIKPYDGSRQKLN